MRIGILCFRSYDAYDLSGEFSLKVAAELRGHELILIHVPRLVLSPKGEIIYEGKQLLDFDGFISRARVIDQVENRLFWIKILEEKGFKVLNSYDALIQAKNKWFTTEKLRKAGVQTVPTWIVEDETVAFRTAEEIGYPVVLKQVHGTYGFGVAKAENETELQQILDRFWKSNFIQPILLQPFIVEAESKDHRIFVVGDRVIASREREAHGDFRANMELGATSKAVEVSSEELNLVLNAVRALDLDYAGVDTIQTKTGPAVLEVNGNTGFRTLDEISEAKVLGALIELAVLRFQKS